MMFGRVSSSNLSYSPSFWFFVSEDEGKYYCQRVNDTKWGEVFQLKVAFVDEIPDNQKVKVEPEIPILGKPLILNCPVPNAFPPPKVTWTVVIPINQELF